MRFEDYECIRFERDGKILRIVLDRPEALNAVDEQLTANRAISRCCHTAVLVALLHVRRTRAAICSLGYWLSPSRTRAHRTLQDCGIHAAEVRGGTPIR